MCIRDSIKRDLQLNVVNCDASACTPNSVDESNLIKNIQIFPNPTTDKVNITLTVGTISLVKLYDLSGSKIKEWGGEETISLRNEASGIFILEVQNHKGMIHRSKVVKL